MTDAFDENRHQFHPTLLREYDVRGIVGETLFSADAYHLGRAFASRVRGEGGNTLCVGRDGRISSPELCRALVDGLTAGGCQVADIGCGPTPMLYYVAKTRSAAGGVMVTGSHNPPDHNGFKMVLEGRPFFGEEIQDLGRLAAAGDYAAGAGRAMPLSVADEYCRRLLLDYDGVRPLRVVWDVGNGATGELVTALTSHLPGRHEVLYATVDGHFPHHHPDPTIPENLRDLQARVRETHADLGLAFDGDGDRLGVVDGQGNILWGDQILVLLAEDLLKKQPGATIIADVKASRVFFEETKRLGGHPLMGRTGHSLIKNLMAETKAALAGEMSGHIFFADHYYGFDDALYAAVRLLGIVARLPAGVDLAQWRRRLPVMVNTPEIRIPCPEERKFQIIEDVKAQLRAAGATFNDLDGMRVESDDGWWLLRASNTQAVLVARCEAGDDEGLARLKAQLTEYLAPLRMKSV